MRTQDSKSQTGTTTSVATSTVAATLLAANPNREAASIYNDSLVVLYVKYGSGASSSSFKIAMAAGSYFEFPQPIYTGIVTGILASSTGNARMSEES